MNDAARPSQSIIWATRGRSWGFRFLLRGGLADPLSEYERAFAEVSDEPQAWARVSGKVAVRLRDPQDRKDASGRVIPHQFVVSGELASSIGSVEDGFLHLWPLVEEIFDDIWQAERPPGSEGIEARLDQSDAR
ncbi:hypothetical protein [Nocardioides sp. NPDC127503]|uniref:hypothetical protein n=1 Tax=Nocardioides sp. NPDC127503 TaxID=3154516 RepID=UPI003316AE10